MIHLESLSDLEDGDHGWVSPPLLKAAEIMLREPRALGELLLGQPLGETDPPHIATDELPHIHGSSLALRGARVYTLEYIARARHDPLMHPDHIAPAPLDGLSALFARNELSDAEQKRMRDLTSHLLQSNIYAAHPDSDGELVAYLLGQWKVALDDVDNEMELASEPFVVHAVDAAWVLGGEVGDFRAGIARLAGERIVSAAPTGEGTLVSFAPTIEAMSPRLETQVYRDYVARHGRLLHGLAVFYLDAIGSDLSELEASSGAEVTIIRQRHNTIIQEGRVDTLLSAWADTPQRMYEWLDQLTAVELDLAVNTGSSLGLRHDLHRFDTDRVAILSGSLDPSR